MKDARPGTPRPPLARPGSPTEKILRLQLPITKKNASNTTALHNTLLQGYQNTLKKPTKSLEPTQLPPVPQFNLG